MTSLLGASYRTGIVGVALVALSGLLFYLDQKAEAAVCFTTGIGFLNSRDASATSEQQAKDPGYVSAAPLVTAPLPLQATGKEIPYNYHSSEHSHPEKK